MFKEVGNSEIMIVLAFLVLLQLQFTWCGYIASAIEGIGGTSYNTDAASATSATPTSVPSISPRFIFIHKTYYTLICY